MQQNRFGFMNPYQFGALGMEIPTNGVKPSYAYKIVDGGNKQPVTFPNDAAMGLDVPKYGFFLFVKLL